MIQREGLGEADYRGGRFAAWPRDLKGNNDLLVLTRPDVIRGIHEAYLEAGADILETNSFNANRVSLADYGMEALAFELNETAARLARACADDWTARTPDRPRFVAGVLGPTNRTASISPDVNDPGFRNVRFDDLVTAYAEAARGLIDGRGGSAADRDRVRHPQRQGRGVRLRAGVRRGRRPAAGDDLRHHHRPVRQDADRARRRRRSTTRCATRGRCRSASTARSAPSSCASTSRRCPASPSATSPRTPTPGCRTRWAATTSGRSRWRRRSAPGPRRASSTSSAAAAARRPRTSARSPRQSPACRRARGRRSHRGVASPDSSPATSSRTRCS